MEQAFNIQHLLERIHLTPKQQRDALAIYNVVIESIKHLPNLFRRGPQPAGVEDTLVETTDQIEVHQRNLLHLIELLENYESPCAEFKRNFPKWEPIRIENCELLKYTGEYLQYDHRACTIASLTGNSVGTLGGIAIGCAAAFPPAAPALAVGGLVVGSVGAATSIFSNFADKCRIRKHMNKARKICERDQENFKLLGEWLKHSQDIEKAMGELVGFGVWGKMYENLKSFIGERDPRFWKSLAFSVAIKTCLQYLFPGNAFFIALGVDAIAAIVTTLIAMILFHRQTQSALQCYTLALGLVSAVEKTLAFGLAKAGAKAFLRVFSAFDVVLSAVMITLDSIELAKTEMCAEGLQIVRLAELLEEERGVLREVYEAMMVH